MLLARTLVGLVWLLGVPGVALAQLPPPPDAPSRDEILEGRAAFVRGMEAAQTQRFEDARREFVRSYALSGSPVALFNLASTLRSLGEPVHAAEAFVRLLAIQGLDGTVRSRAEPMYAEVVREVGRLRLYGELDGLDLQVDAGGFRRLAGGQQTLVVAPGSHQLRALREGYVPWEWSGEVPAGRAVDLAVELRRAAEQVASNPTREGDGLDPVPFVVIGAAVLAVVGGVIAAVVIDAEAQLGPRSDLVLELP